MILGNIVFQAAQASADVARAGIQAGEEIGRRESAARIAELERDCMTMALRLYGESYDTFSPEVMECMDRWKPKCAALLRSANGGAS